MPSLTIGVRVGSYEIQEAIGAGGMGEVYRALDTRLKRHVAIKVLPSELTGDHDRLARFQREAEVLASLNHPNIAALYGFEDSGAVQALVMELVDGPTLADRIARGPIPTGESLPLAIQIAQALAAAHEQGIVHRDLKPANIKLRPDGEVKILDFGLAKAMDSVASSTGGSFSATITSPAQMTAAGVILGTAAYMSPEQAAGKPVDRRTDLWAFGAVLFEMLTGRRAFDGETVSHAIASVLKDDPDWSALPSDVPAGIRKLLKRCLEKDRRKRLSDAATAALECEDARASSNDGAEATAPGSRRRWSAWPMMVGVCIGAIVAGVIAWVRSPPPPAPAKSTRFAIDLAAGQTFTRTGRHVVALSPDGMQVVYVADRRLYLRSLRDVVSAPVEGTTGMDPSEPVFSPDGQWIAFWAGGKVKKIPMTGGAAMTLADTANPYGIDWTGDRILVGQDKPRAIVEVPQDGGAAKPIVTVDESKDEWVQSPQLLDGGRAVLFTLRTGSGDWNDAAIVVQDLKSGARTTLVTRGTNGHVLPDGHLAYSRGDTLMIAPIAADRRSISGPAVALEHGILESVGGFTGATQVAWSSAGTFAYVPNFIAGSEQALQWMTRDGKFTPTNLLPRSPFLGSGSMALSPDDKRVALRMLSDGSVSGTDIWIGEFARSTLTRLTFSRTATDPVWTPDGTRVCYEDADAVLCQPFDGSAPPQSVFRANGLSTVNGLTRDNAWWLLTMNGARPENGLDIWIASNTPPFDPKPLLASTANENLPSVSPNGRWMTYAFFETDAGSEVYVRPFPGVTDGRWQISTKGGLDPRWARNSQELYYLATQSAGSTLAYTLTAVPVATGPSFSIGVPTIVAQLPIGARAFDVAADGRFLISIPASAGTGDKAHQSVVIVQNWQDAMRSKLAQHPAER